MSDSSATATGGNDDDIFGSTDSVLDGGFFADEASPPVSDDEEDSVGFYDLFGGASDDEPASASSPHPPAAVAAAAPRALVPTPRKSKKERAAAAREIARKRKAEMDNTPFARACKQITAARRAARTVREVPASELNVQMLRLIALMEDAARKDEAAMAAGAAALHKVVALNDFKRAIAEGGSQLLAFLAKQPRFFSAVRGWLAPTKGALPALDLRTALIDMLLSSFPRLGYNVLRESRIGGVVKFLSECKRENARNKAVCARIVQSWARKRYDEATVVAQRVDARDVNYKKLAARSRTAERSAGLRQSHVIVSAEASVAQTTSRARIPETMRINFTVAPRDKFAHLELRRGGGSGGDALKGTKFGKTINRLKRRR